MAAASLPLAAMPQMLDCMPCAGCYVAPAPVAQGGSAKPGHSGEPEWRWHGLTLPDAPRAADTEGWPPRLPVRIAYCRWLD